MRIYLRGPTRRRMNTSGDYLFLEQGAIGNISRSFGKLTQPLKCASLTRAFLSDSPGHRLAPFGAERRILPSEHGRRACQRRSLAGVNQMVRWCYARTARSA